MAAIAPVIVSGNVSGNDDGSVIKITWEMLTTTNDSGTPVSVPKFIDKTVTFTGTFGVGGTVALQGSNDGTNWYSLTDPQGNAISKTAAGIEAVSENPWKIRPFVSAGDGTTDLDVIVIARLNNSLRT